VAGSYLRTFEITQPEHWVEDYIARQLSANEAFSVPESPVGVLDSKEGK
jgi:hypothetical protein